MQHVRRTALSLFSGAGGMDVGILEAGFEVLATIEKDENCCETLRTNIKREGRSTVVIEGDVREVDPNELMDTLGLASGELDLLFGGPPCQSSSQIGKQLGLEDERGLLIFEMVRFAKAFKPKAILVEQVKGLLSAKGHEGRRGEIMDMLLADLEEAGYIPKWSLINVADYGVPQTRKRLFIVATEKPNGFKFPIPTHAASDDKVPLFGLPPYMTVGDAIEGLGDPSPKGDEREDSHIDVTPAGDRFRINGVPEGKYLASQTHLPKSQLKNLTRKDTTKFLRLSREKPSNTLRCGEIFFHPTENRYITPREAMRIHGYPDSYVLKGPIRGRSGSVRNLDQHRQVANSVPPPVAESLGEAIKKTLECRESSKFSVIT